MTNKEKFLALVSKEKTNTLKELRARIKNREMLRESQKIAYKVLVRLEELGWTKIQFAEKMGVSVELVNKIVKGQENLTLKTLVKIQNVLDVPILATYNKSKKTREGIKH